MPAKENNNLPAYIATVMGKILQRPRLGNPVYLGGEAVIPPGGEETITIKASTSKDLLVLTISASQDGTPSDRLDPWQMDLMVKSMQIMSELKTDVYEQIVDGEIPFADLFGRDTGEPVVELLSKNQDITFIIRNRDPFSSHRANISMRCAFWPPTLTGVEPPKEE